MITRKPKGGDSAPIFIAGFEEILLAEAETAATAASVADRPNLAGAKAMTAILLSVAAVEALVGTWSALFRNDYGIDQDTLGRWRRIGIPDIIKDILGRRHPPILVKEVKWFNGLCAITTLRNHVAHYSPEFRAPGTWPEEIAGIVTSRLLRPEGDESMDWTSRLLVGSVALQVVVYARTARDGFMELAWRKP